MYKGLIIGVAILLGAGSLLVTRRPRADVHIYPVKFVCGIMPNTLSMSGVDPNFVWAVNPGRYTTSINIQNPNSTTTNIRKEIMLAPRENTSAQASTSINMALPGRSATAADCPDIYLNMGLHASSTVYMEGFLNVLSSRDLYITAVYTGQNLMASGTQQEMSTMDIEEVVGKILPR